VPADLRDQIYKLKPEIKRDFVSEHTYDKQRFETLNTINIQASDAELVEKYDEAQKAYSELLEVSNYGYFKLLSEAVLRRVPFRDN
jgi:hypothetical protein